MIEQGKQYRTKSGLEVRIYAMDGSGMYPIHGAYRYEGSGWEARTWSAEGKYNTIDEESILDLVEATPWDHIRIDDKVLVWDEDDPEGCKSKRHFAGVGLGKPKAWDDGQTSWTANEGEWGYWDHCEKADV